jgi:hypothetical protein
MRGGEAEARCRRRRCLTFQTAVDSFYAPCAFFAINSRRRRLIDQHPKSELKIFPASETCAARSESPKVDGLEVMSMRIPCSFSTTASVWVTHPRSSSLRTSLQNESAPMHTTMNMANAAIALLEDVIAARGKCLHFSSSCGRQHFRIHRKTGLRGLSQGTYQRTHSFRKGSGKGVRFTGDAFLE